MPNHSFASTIENLKALSRTEHHSPIRFCPFLSPPKSHHTPTFPCRLIFKLAVRSSRHGLFTTYSPPSRCPPGTRYRHRSSTLAHNWFSISFQSIVTPRGSCASTHRRRLAVPISSGGECPATKFPPAAAPLRHSTACTPPGSNSPTGRSLRPSASCKPAHQLCRSWLPTFRPFPDHQRVQICQVIQLCAQARVVKVGHQLSVLPCCDDEVAPGGRVIVGTNEQLSVPALLQQTILKLIFAAGRFSSHHQMRVNLPPRLGVLVAHRVREQVFQNRSLRGSLFQFFKKVGCSV